MLNSSSVVYQVGWSTAGSHRFEVRIQFPAGHNTLIFPSWAPGSYLMREFARNVRDISATDAQGLPVVVQRDSRNAWTVQTEEPYSLYYQVYAREKSVRTPFLDETLAFFIPTNLLVFDPNHREGQFTLQVKVPEGHTGVCPLGASVVGPATASWVATDMDVLYDSPVAVGPFEERFFDVLGIPHYHYLEPGHDGDPDRMAADLQKIVEAASRLFGSTLPYSSYTFLSLLTRDGHGGLEHLNSSVLLRPRIGFRNAKGYEEFLTLAAHEHFHAWNVKRIRPTTLSAPFAYEKENYTRTLWWLEGATVYYEERIVLRAGLLTESRHYERLADLARRLERVPGRRHQSLEDSSFDAWIKLYRPGEDSNNSTVSYYLKGAVVAWILDLELLNRSDGAVGLDRFLGLLWERYAAKGEPFSEEGTLEALGKELGGGEGWDAWWERHIRGTEEVQLAEALACVGIDLCWSGGGQSWLGVEVGGIDRVVVHSVREDGPASSILSPGDELIAVNGERISGPDLSARLADLPIGTNIRLLIARDGRILEVSLTTSSTPATELKLVPRTDADERQLRLRATWLGLS